MWKLRGNEVLELKRIAMGSLRLERDINDQSPDCVPRTVFIDGNTTTSSVCTHNASFGTFELSNQELQPGTLRRLSIREVHKLYAAVGMQDSFFARCITPECDLSASEISSCVGQNINISSADIRDSISDCNLISECSNSS